jgi:hypothetical protein
MVKRTFSHLDYLKIEADFSPDKKYRYSLSLTHKERAGGQTICVIMQNPSLANVEHADKTIQFIEKLVFEKDYAQFQRAYKLIIVNQFAYMQTKGFEGKLSEVGPKNDLVIQKALAESDDVIIGWGKTNSFYERQRFIFSHLEGFRGSKWLTKKHPSRGHYEDFLVPLELPNELKHSSHFQAPIRKKSA